MSLFGVEGFYFFFKKNLSFSPFLPFGIAVAHVARCLAVYGRDADFDFTPKANVFQQLIKSLHCLSGTQCNYEAYAKSQNSVACFSACQLTAVSSKLFISLVKEEEVKKRQASSARWYNCSFFKGAIGRSCEDDPGQANEYIQFESKLSTPFEQDLLRCMWANVSLRMCVCLCACVCVCVCVRACVHGACTTV